MARGVHGGASQGPHRRDHAGPRRRGARPRGLQEAAAERRRLGREEMKTVYIVATLDTKGVEAAFVRDQLAALKVPAKIIDSGCIGSPAVQADISREEVFHLAGTSLAA